MISVSTRVIKIATRQSQLALWQAEYVQAALKKLDPGLTIELVKMTTQGDKILDTPLAKIGGKGLFVKELENGLLDKSADIAVHSMKDVPVSLPENLHISALLLREDPRDAFVSNHFADINSLPKNAIVGTSSLRRECQLRRLRPDLNIQSLRGNVNTRLAKLDRGDFAAIILASAGLIRLGMQPRIRSYIAPELILPAIAQGVIGIESRIDDSYVNRLMQGLHDQHTAICVAAERAFNKRLQGGCQVPIGGYAQLSGDQLRLRGLVGESDGSRIIEDAIAGSASQAEELGNDLAERLLSRGADKILEKLYNRE